MSTGLSSAGGISRYVPALDGVRGLAIALVLAHHLIQVEPSQAFFPELVRSVVSSLWAGVDLFFVLSGFLISGILLDSRTDRGYYRVFYGRRFLRIFPLYYGFLLVLFTAAAFGRSRGCVDCPTLLENQGWFWGYATNLLVVRDGWSSLPFNTGPLWSLAVEEQFYLIWPALVLSVSTRRLVLICVALVLLSPIARLAIHLGGAPYTVSYTLSLVRFDGFAVGALIALAVRNPAWETRLRQLSSSVGVAAFATVALIGVAYGGLDRARVVVQTLGYSALALGFGALVAWAVCARPDSMSQRFFRHGLMTRLGLYSYGVYVFHFPVLYAVGAIGIDVAAVRNVIGNQALAIALHAMGVLALVLAIAALSWHLFEAPILRLKSRFAYGTATMRPPPVVAAGAGSLTTHLHTEVLAKKTSF